MDDFTRKFNIATEKDAEIHQILSTVYRALEEKGYNPINQIVGYILSEDPTYITNHNNARTLIRKIDRDELLQVLVRRYLGQKPFSFCIPPQRGHPCEWRGDLPCGIFCVQGPKAGLFPGIGCNFL